MSARLVFLHAIGCSLLLAGASGCERRATPSADGVIQTKFPGEVTAGGGTSGQVLASHTKPVTESTYAGGTPGTAGGSGGTTGGTATGGTVQESGQGPSRGTTQPASAGQPGTNLQPGEHKPPTVPANPPVSGAASQRDNPPPVSNSPLGSRQGTE